MIARNNGSFAKHWVQTSTKKPVWGVTLLLQHSVWTLNMLFAVQGLVLICFLPAIAVHFFMVNEVDAVTLLMLDLGATALGVLAMIIGSCAGENGYRRFLTALLRSVSSACRLYRMERYLILKLLGALCSLFLTVLLLCFYAIVLMLLPKILLPLPLFVGIGICLGLSEAVRHSLVAPLLAWQFDRRSPEPN